MELNTQTPIVPPVRPKNWLVESILVTILCCMPFGIAGIVFAAQVNARYDLSDFEGAVKASRDAGKWTKIAFFIGLTFWVLYFLFFFFLGGAAIWGSMKMMNNNY